MKTTPLYTIIPATSGYFALTCTRGEDGEAWFEKSAIVAWRVSSADKDGLNYVTPVQIQNDMPDHRSVLRPDGVVECESFEFGSLEEWERAQRELFARLETKGSHNEH